MATGALGGSAGAPLTPGGDYACGERVFAPPTGTLDVDWLVPAVAEAHPGTAHAVLRAATVRVWEHVRALAGGRPLHEVHADEVLRALGDPTPVERTAVGVVVDAVRLFGAH